MKHIGFTGTRHGMTAAQCHTMRALMKEAESALGDPVAHHGDCVGADADYHALARDRLWPVIVHPPVDNTHRAGCDNWLAIRAPLTHMARNRAIVAAADVMLACPYEQTEQPRGGTWATIRMARKARKPLAIVLPDGTVQYERWDVRPLPKARVIP